MKINNWTITFEKEDGSEIDIHDVLDERDVEYIDDRISAIISENGLWPSKDK
jgi:hypothetical protein